LYVSYIQLLCIDFRVPNEPQQQVGRFCTTTRAGVASIPSLAVELTPAISSSTFLVGQDSREECQTLRILRMKEPCTWLLRTRALLRGALIGPNDQGLVAYLATREAELV